MNAHNKLIIITLTAMLLMASFIIIPQESSATDIYDTDFSSNTDWYISGGTFSITGGQLLGTNVVRTSVSQYAKYALDSPLDQYNTTFDLQMTSEGGASGSFIFIGMYTSNFTATTTANVVQSEDTAWLACGWDSADEKRKIALQYYDNGAKVDGGFIEYTIGTTYHVNFHRYNDSGVWKCDMRLFTSSYDIPLKQLVTTITGTPSDAVAFIACNLQGEYPTSTMSGLVDNLYITDGIEVPPSPAFSTYPMLSAFEDVPYTYDAGATVSGTYSLGGTADWLSINATTGVVSGTPNAVGAYSVSVSLDNGTGFIYQNYTLSVYEAAEFSNNGLVSPISDINNMGTAVWHKGDLYITYIGAGTGSNPSSNIYVTKFDGELRTWSNPVSIGANPTDVVHGHSTLAIDGDDYVHVFYGCHLSDLLHVKSSAPLDITSWTALAPIDSSATYPQPYYDHQTDTFYLFFRHTVSGLNCRWSYVTSTDNGNTWSSRHDYLAVDSSTISPYVYGIEPLVITGQLHFGFIYTYYNGDSGQREDVCYARLNTVNGIVYNITGSSLGSSVDDSEKTSTQILEESDAWLGRLHYDGTNMPHITFHSLSEYCFKYGYFSESSWHFETIPGSESLNTLHGSQLDFYWNDTDIEFIIAKNSATDEIGGDILHVTRHADGNYTANGWIMTREQVGIDGAYVGHPALVSGSTYNEIIFTSDSRNTSVDYAHQDYATGMNLYVWSESYGFLIDGINPDGSTLPDTFGFITIPDTTALANQTYTYDADVNISGATFTLITDAAWLSINATTGVVSGTPDATGTFNVTIQATVDGTTVNQTYTLTVSEGLISPSLMNGMIEMIVAVMLLMAMVSIIGMVKVKKR